MFEDPLILLYGAMFVGVLLLVEGIYYLVDDLRGGPKANINRRLRLLDSSDNSQEALHKLRRRRADGKAQMFTNLVPRLEKLLAQSGTTITAGQVLAMMVGVAVIMFGLLVFVAKLNMVTGPILALLLGIALPVVFLMRKRRARLAKFVEQLPDALDMVVRSLRAGHPINSAISLVSTEFPDPMGSEFGIAIDEMTYGLDLGDALANLAQRVPHQDLHFVVVAIEIQSSTGGNLAEVLTKLSETIRNRFQMMRKIRALSAEGRLSALILSLLPFFVGAAIMAMNPDYYTDVIDDPLLPKLLLSGAGVLMVGVFIMWRMVNFRI